jgi:hypothetical protein
MRRVAFLLLCCAAFATGAQAQAPCCSVTAINAATGVVSAKVSANSAVFQFKVTNANLLKELRVGQGVYANFMTHQISLDGKTIAGPITSGAQGPAPAPVAPLPPVAARAPQLPSASQPPASAPPKAMAPANKPPLGGSAPPTSASNGAPSGPSSPPYIATPQGAIKAELSSISLSVVSRTNISLANDTDSCAFTGKINPASACDLWEFSPITLAAIGNYSNGTSEPLTTAKWSRSNAGNPLVTITDAGSGNVTLMGIASGNTTITASAGSLSASLPVTVFSPVAISIACLTACTNVPAGQGDGGEATFLLVKPGLMLLANGGGLSNAATEQSTVQFGAMALTTENCNQGNCSYFVSKAAKLFLNGPANVATLSATGLATVQAVGTVRIAATFPGDYPSTCTTAGISGPSQVPAGLNCATLIVLPLTSITVFSPVHSTAVGQAIQFRANTLAGNWSGGGCAGPACGDFDLGRVVTWTSSAPAVATVNSTGLVTATGVGTTTITASVSTGSTTAKGAGFTSTSTTGHVTGSQTLIVTN